MLSSAEAGVARSTDPSLHRALSFCRYRHLAAVGLEYLAQGTAIASALYIAVTLLTAVTVGLTPKLSLALASAATACVLAFAAWSIARMPYTELDAARQVDLTLGLQERLSSAVELAGTDSPFARLISQEAQGLSDLVKPRVICPIQWPGRAVLAMAGLMVAAAVTFIPYGASLGGGSTREADTRLAAEGYKLLEEAQRVTANAQAIGDQHLQQIGEELSKTARRMTERFSSERQVERDLQKYSKALDDINRQELSRSTALSDAGAGLEDAYSRLTGQQGQRNAAALQQQMREAMRQAAGATSDESLARRLDDGGGSTGATPSDSDVLEAMQRMQEEAAQSQSRQGAVGQALDSLNQSMAALGYERPRAEAPPEGQRSGEGQGEQPGDDADQTEAAGSGQGPGEPEDGAESALLTEGSGGQSGTQGAHVDATGAPQPLPKGAGETQRLTGQKTQGAAASTTVITGADAAPASGGTSGVTTGPSSFGGSGAAQEEAGSQERIPAAYRRIVADYFGRRK